MKFPGNGMGREKEKERNSVLDNAMRVLIQSHHANGIHS